MIDREVCGQIATSSFVGLAMTFR